jgi:3-hydroxyacyl-CoA dehydrogenase
MVENGIATPEDIDIALKLGYEIPFGTFEHMDIIGLDTVQDVLTGRNIHGHGS